MTPAFIQRSLSSDAHVPLRAGELRAVVDAGEAAVVLHLERGDEAAVLAGHRDEIREVHLAGRRRRLEIPDAPSQPRRVERIQAGVDLGDLALVIARVLVLDDPLNRPALVADHAAEPRGIEGIDGDEREGRVVERARLEEGGEQVGADERHIPGDHEDLLGLAGQRGKRRAEGVTRASGLVLERGVRPVPDGVADGLGGRRVHDDRAAPGGLLGGIEHEVDHRAAAQLVEDLGRARLHPRAETGREDDGDGPAHRGVRT